MTREMEIQIYNVQKIPNTLNLKNSTLRYIIIKFSKSQEKENMLKTTKEKLIITCKEKTLKLSAIYQQKPYINKEWKNIFKLFKQKKIDKEYSIQENCALK